MKKNSIFLIFACISIVCSSCHDNKEENAVEMPKTPEISYVVSKVYPHDTTSFTEGFLFENGQLFESTGYSASESPGSKSWFGIVDLSTGKISPKAELDRTHFFGEGISFLQGKVFQLTWQNKVGFIYDANSFRKTGEFNLPLREGWGMTTNGSSLLMSDGTDKISWVDPQSFQVRKTVSVKDVAGPVININELELINGYLYANRFLTNDILKIDTSTGSVVGKLNLFLLEFEAKNKYPFSNALNGIAFDKKTDRIFVTGKLWPSIYELKFDH